MMISREGYRKELENLTPEELYERKKRFEKFINDYENNNLSERDYMTKPSPQTRYELYKEYLNEVITKIDIRRNQSEMEGIKVSKSQCADCKNYLGDINCKIFGEINFDILGNKKNCPEKKANNITENENNFSYLNNEIENLTKELAEAYRNNDQEQINKLQDRIKEETDKQLKTNVDELVIENLKESEPIVIEDLENKSYINREVLLNKLGYLYNYKEKRKNYSTEEDFILGELKTIKDELLANDGIDMPYIPTMRVQHCINEFLYYLERKQANDCLMDIYEVIESDKNEIYSPINKDFKYSIYIFNEEKSIILNMVNRLESYLNNSDNEYSTKNLFEKAKLDFNSFNEFEYGVNKYLSLPLPVEHNKLKSLILLSSVSENEEIYNCGHILIDINTGNIEYKLEKEQLLSNDPKLNLLNFIPKTHISINNKEEYDNLYIKFFSLLDDLILMYSSKKEYISRTDKVKEFLNIYRNIVSESEQIEYSLNNDFLAWCLVLVPNQPIKKLEFEKTNVVVRETYIDENGHERDREKTIEMPVFPKQESVDNEDIVKAICKQIEELPNGTEFTLQQFMKDYNLEEKDKFGLCGSIFEYCKNNNIEIIEKYPDAVLGLPHNIPRIKKSNEQNSNQLSKEDFDNFLTTLINKHQEIKFKDNNKNVSYTIEKDGDNYNIKLEKKINFNENINNLFNDLIQYCNSITDTSKYWPNSEQEYPDLKIIWEIYTKLGNESNKLNGALSYPEKWDELINKINDEFNVMLSNEEKSLVSRIDERLKEINPDYEPPEIDYSKIDNNEKHTVEELISIIDDKLEKIDTEE